MAPALACVDHCRGIWWKCDQPSGNYPYDLGPSPSNYRIQVAESELNLNLPGSISAELPSGGCTNQAGLGLLLGERKMYHAQEWSGKNLSFSKWVYINAHPFCPDHYPESSQEEVTPFWG